MIALVGLAVSYVPAVLWLAVFLSQDRYDPQPRRLIAALFLLGVGATAPAAWINDFLGAGAGAPASALLPLIAVVVAPLGEETLKASFALVGARGAPSIREPVDAMIALMTVGLGFAAGETTSYVINEYRHVLTQPGATERDAFVSFLDLAVRRGVITTLAHACWAGITGYALARFLLSGRQAGIGLVGVLAATGLHAAFNLASSGVLVVGGSTATVVAVWITSVGVAVALFARALAQSPFRRQQLRARLMGMPLLADIPPERLAAAAERLELVTARPGDVVVAEGDASDRFYIVDQGFLVAVHGPIDATTRILRRMGPGEVFGQLGLLLNTNRTASVVAETDVTLLALDGESFREMVGGDPVVTARLLDLHRTDTAAAVIGGSLLAHVRQARASRVTN